MSEDAVLRSYGGAGTVTGSCHRLDLGGVSILVDAGAFQGSRALQRRNLDRFAFDPSLLDAVCVTHGHLDHVGRLPRLVAQGFAGPIYVAPGTKAVAGIILRDAAKIAEEDYARAVRRARRAGLERSVEPPAFGMEEVERVVAAMVEMPYGLTFACHGVGITFRPAGHVVGSAWITFESGRHRIVVSGDLGNREGILHPPAEPPLDATAIVAEATYGNRTHRRRDDTRQELEHVLRRAVERGGHVLVPSFALDRTQSILYEIARGQRAGTIPTVPVFLDAPMADSMTDVYRDHLHDFRDDVQQVARAGEDPFTPPWFEATSSIAASRRLNDMEGPAIVIAGSGMMTGGRIVHHAKHHLWKPTTHVVIIGYQAKGTLGRALVDGASHVRIHGERIAVAAQVHTIGGLSAHADRDDLDAWIAASPSAPIWLVHADGDVAVAYRDHLAGRGRMGHVVDEGVDLPLHAS